MYFIPLYGNMTQSTGVATVGAQHIYSLSVLLANAVAHMPL